MKRVTDPEERRLRRLERLGRPSGQPRYLRKKKLKMRFKHRLADEIARTVEKLELLREIQFEEEVSQRTY